MISSDLEGADLESRVASWAASATSDDAAAVRAVIEAYDDRLAAADVAGFVSQHTGNAAVVQPELETVVGSQQLSVTHDAAFKNMRLDFYVPIRRHHRQRRPRGSQGNKPGDDHDPRYRRDATSASPAAVRSGTHGGATGRSRSTCTSRRRSGQEGAAPESGESATRIRALSASVCGRRARRGGGGHVDLPARAGAVQVDVGVARAVRVCSWAGGRCRRVTGGSARAAGWRLPGGTRGPAPAHRGT